MIKIRPFAAIIYNYKHKACHPGKVICPPYDVISSSQAKMYRGLSRYNMVHLTLPKSAGRQDKYKAAALRFQQCLKNKIFSQDKQPAIYFHEQEFKAKNTRLRRLGFIACLGLSDKPSIYGHEHTRIEPKEDRFKLLVNVQANLEPIFTLFSDPQGFIQEVFARYVRRRKPLTRFRDQEKNINTLWRLTSPKILKEITRRLKDKNLFIADGHHRYEVSLNYQQQKPKRPHDKDQDYIMAYFCPLQSPGLVVNPVHRLVKGINSLPMDRLRKFFLIRKTTRAGLFRQMQSRTARQRMLGVYFHDNFYIFILKNKQLLAKIDKDYRSLDIALLNQIILKRILKVEPSDKQRVIFGADADDFIRRADKDKTSVVFLIKPVRISDIVSLARTGKKMPPKTTYFHPKVPSGMVIFKFS